MAGNTSPRSRRDFEADLVARAWKDADFRKRLKSNPKGVIEEELKKHGDASLPADLKISVLEESVHQLYVVIPNKPDAKQEMSDDQLTAVAGGTIIIIAVNGSVAIVTYV